MSNYLKLDFNTHTRTNFAMKEALIHIGRRNGKLKDKEGYPEKEYLKAGIHFVAKKFGRFRKNAIKYMVFTKKIKNSSNKRWCFNKQVYGRAYSEIISLLLRSPIEDREVVHDLLRRLYNETVECDDCSAKMCSDALIYCQKRMLLINSVHVNFDIAKQSSRLLNSIKENDKPLP